MRYIVALLSLLVAAPAVAACVDLPQVPTNITIDQRLSLDVYFSRAIVFTALGTVPEGTAWTFQIDRDYGTASMLYVLDSSGCVLQKTEIDPTVWPGALRILGSGNSDRRLLNLLYPAIPYGPEIRKIADDDEPALPPAGAYKDTPTSAWFKSLSSVKVTNCCDQADCAKADSEWRGTPSYTDGTGKLVPGKGEWWARSNRTGQWMKVDDDMITREKDGSIQYSILDKAVLCESPVVPSDDAHPQAQFYCFAPPPVGF